MNHPQCSVVLWHAVHPLCVLSLPTLSNQYINRVLLADFRLVPYYPRKARMP